MTKYQVLLHYGNGEDELDDTQFDSEDSAEEYGGYLASCSEEGAETLNMSNPGDYPLDDFESTDWEVVETD